MAKQRMFTVISEGKTRLIQAESPAQVRKHLLASTEIDEADSVQVASMLGRGIKVEIANKEVA